MRPRRICLDSWVAQENPDPSEESHPRRYFCWLCCRPSRGQPSSPDVAFVRPPEGEWESEPPPPKLADGSLGSLQSQRSWQNLRRVRRLRGLHGSEEQSPRQRVLAGSYHARGAIIWEGKSWCWARLCRLGNRNRAGSFGRRGPQVAALPCNALSLCLGIRRCCRRCPG